MESKALLVGIAIAVAVPTAIAAWLFTRPVWRIPAASEMRLEITTPPTTDPVSLAISPDGRSVVFVGSAEGLSRLWIRRLDSTTPRQLVGTEYASLPFWSPDGRSIGFFADGKIKRVDPESGLVRGRRPDRPHDIRRHAPADVARPQSRPDQGHPGRVAQEASGTLLTPA